MTTRDAGKGSGPADDDASPEARAIAARLAAIVQAVGGCRVETRDDELWFDLESDGDLQVRLSAEPEARCYDRSASFGISHGGQPSAAPVPARFRAAVDAIKAIDAERLPGLATAFRPAARAVVRRLSGDDVADRPEESAAPAQVPLASESPEGQALNVIFLDLCARLAGRPAETLLPLHWGFWPADGHTPDGYDPQQAYSEALLAHVPERVTRILDVGCGLGFHERILSALGKRVTAVSPVPHHCAVVERARLPGVEVRCARFEDMAPEAPYDLLLFAESVNHFMLHGEFMRHCARFLTDAGYMLMADDLSTASVRQIEAQREFRVLGRWDITRNVAPTTDWFARQLPALAAYHRAVMAILELRDPAVAARVATILDSLENGDLKALFSGRAKPPATQGRYMIFLLQRAAAA